MLPRTERARSLASLRHDLAEIDHALVLLVAARVVAACSAIRIRSERGESITNPPQEARVLARARSWAVEVGLSPDLVESLFRSIVAEGKRKHSASTSPALAAEALRARHPGRMAPPLRRVSLRSSVRAPIIS